MYLVMLHEKRRYFSLSPNMICEERIVCNWVLRVKTDNLREFIEQLLCSLFLSVCLEKRYIYSSRGIGEFGCTVKV